MRRYLLSLRARTFTASLKALRRELRRALVYVLLLLRDTCLLLKGLLGLLLDKRLVL